MSRRKKKGDEHMVFQLGAPLLDACVLAVLSQQDAYGYVLTQSVQNVIDISESTLYPVLRRLQKEGCLVTYDQPYMGRNRRYYKITETGLGKLDYYRKEWKEFTSRIDTLLGDTQLVSSMNHPK